MDIFGVDSEGQVTPIMVRDATLRCYLEAHGDTLAEFFNISPETSENFDKIIKEKITNFIRETFKEVGGDFDNPTKESLLAVIDEVKKLSSQFRDQNTIGKHYSEIKTLIDKLN